MLVVDRPAGVVLQMGSRLLKNMLNPSGCLDANKISMNAATPGDTGAVR